MAETQGVLTFVMLGVIWLAWFCRNATWLAFGGSSYTQHGGFLGLSEYFLSGVLVACQLTRKPGWLAPCWILKGPM